MRFVNDLMQKHNGVWHEWVLKVAPIAMGHVQVVGRTLVDIAALIRQDKERMEMLAAKSAFTRMVKPKVPKRRTIEMSGSEDDGSSTDSGFGDVKKKR